MMIFIIYACTKGWTAHTYVIKPRDISTENRMIMEMTMTINHVIPPLYCERRTSTRALALCNGWIAKELPLDDEHKERQRTWELNFKLPFELIIIGNKGIEVSAYIQQRNIADLHALEWLYHWWAPDFPGELSASRAIRNSATIETKNKKIKKAKTKFWDLDLLRCLRDEKVKVNSLRCGGVHDPAYQSLCVRTFGRTGLCI